MGRRADVGFYSGYDGKLLKGFKQRNNKSDPSFNRVVLSVCLRTD